MQGSESGGRVVSSLYVEKHQLQVQETQHLKCKKLCMKISIKITFLNEISRFFQCCVEESNVREW